jgi:hypothetical protein
VNKQDEAIDGPGDWDPAYHSSSLVVKGAKNHATVR